jgi:triosephosphate isomerase
MLKEVCVDIIEIGHSERRRILRETDEEENRKVLAALRHGFLPLLCVGETEEQKNFGISDEILAMQIKIGLHKAPKEQIGRCMIAYEPAWAIGISGKPASVDYAAERHRPYGPHCRTCTGKRVWRRPYSTAEALIMATPPNSSGRKTLTAFLSGAAPGRRTISTKLSAMF